MKLSRDQTRGSVELFSFSFSLDGEEDLSLDGYIIHHYNEHVMKFLPYRRVLIKECKWDFSSLATLSSNSKCPR